VPDIAFERLRAQLGAGLVPIAVSTTFAVAVVGTAGALAHQTGGTAASTAPAPAPAPARASAADGGADVAAVQRRLGIAADGVLGPQTRRAIKRLQRRRGLRPDGVLGPATLQALRLKGRLTATPPPSLAGSPAPSPPSARLRRIARCESGGDPTAVSPDGRYRGKYQFSRATWRSLGGTGDPADAPEAEQDRLAAELLRTQGPSAWPACSR